MHHRDRPGRQSRQEIDTTTTAATPSAADLHEAEHIRRHHAHMVAQLDSLAAALDAAPEGSAGQARADLIRCFVDELLPHAAAEEDTTYRAAAGVTEGRLLVDSLEREHLLIRTAIDGYRAAPDREAAIWALALGEIFRSHQAKEDEVVTPLLLAAPGVSLAQVHGGH